MGALHMTLARNYTPDEAKARFPADLIWVAGQTWRNRPTLFTLIDGDMGEICSALHAVYTDEVIDFGKYEWGRPGALRGQYVLRRWFRRRFFWRG